MHTRVALVLVLVSAVLAAATAGAQDLVVSNVRVITGTGQVIEQGTIVVKGGRIASVAAGPAAPAGAKVVDAKGMTAVAGFIDNHRHIVQGDGQKYLDGMAADRMREFLEAGYTTLVSGGGGAEPVIELKRRIDAGQLKGPRIVPSGPLNLNKSTPEMARAGVQKLAAMGVKFTGEINVNR